MEKTLSDKLYLQKDGKQFAYAEDIKGTVKKLKEGCGEEFRDSYYKDMTLSICGKVTNLELRFCKGCRKWHDKINKHVGKDLI